jgi:hypothetical protein
MRARPFIRVSLALFAMAAGVLRVLAHPGSGIAVDAQGRVFFTAGPMIVMIETNGVARTIVHDVKNEKFYQLHHIQRAPDGGLVTASDLGNAVWHSGTLAGAKQATLLGMRGIAFSAPATETEQPNFDALKPWVSTVLQSLLEVPELKLVNVNFPARPPRGTVWTCQSVRHYDGKVVPGKDPMGRTHYWFTTIPVEATEEGTDRWAIEQGFVSITPITLDLTDREALQRVRKLESWKQLKFA